MCAGKDASAVSTSCPGARATGRGCGIRSPLARCCRDVRATATADNPLCQLGEPSGDGERLGHKWIVVDASGSVTEARPGPAVAGRYRERWLGDWSTGIAGSGLRRAARPIEFGHSVPDGGQCRVGIDDADGLVCEQRARQEMECTAGRKPARRNGSGGERGNAQKNTSTRSSAAPNHSARAMRPSYGAIRMASCTSSTATTGRRCTPRWVRPCPFGSWTGPPTLALRAEATDA